MDADRIEEGGPWNFNSHLLVLLRLCVGENQKEVPLHTVVFWVLVNKLLHGVVSELVAKCMGDFIGKYVEFDAKAVALGSIGMTRV